MNGILVARRDWFSQNGRDASIIVICHAWTRRSDQPRALEFVTLLAALAQMTIHIPLYSDSNRYAVAVSNDRTGNDLLCYVSVNAIYRWMRKTGWSNWSAGHLLYQLS